MAIFDKSGTKQIVEFFETIGYPVQFINVNDETKNFDKFVFPYSANPEYKVYFYNSPITIKGVEKNDEYNIYFTSDLTSYDFKNIFYVEDGKLKTKERTEGWNQKEVSNLLQLEVVSKGITFLDDVEFDVSEYENANEFANFENFDSIDAPDYSVIYGDDPQVSVASPILNIEELTASQIRKAEEKLQQSKKALADLIEADKKGDISSAMWTFDEVDELYNSKISEDDKRAFFIYLQNKTRKKLTGDFDAKYGSAYPAQANTILELMKKGCLFYDPTAKLGERLQSKVIYQSGNIWKKWGSLTNKKDEYIKRFGQTIYDLHVSTLEPIWVEINKTRLSVRGDKDMRLILIPISSLAEDIKISGIISPQDKATIQENFKVYTSFKKGELVEDYLNDYGSSNNYINKKVISLQEGFILWCKQAGRGQQAQENGIQWSAITTGLEELLDYYIKPKSNPFSKEKGGIDKWARYQDDAKKVGERLFAQFLAEGLTPEDQLKVEYIWNSIYNSYREPNLDEVPIGFTYKKYLKDISLFILRDSNLRAIRYYLTRGSIGLAYGVGLGKTFCSIFTMKQALDLGIVKRPLVIVPNQVYFQFAREIRDGLGEDFNPTKANTRLNMFYNGSDNNNVLGNNAVDGINLCTYEATENFQFAKENLDLTWVEEAVNIIEMGGEIKNEPIVEGFLDAHKKGLFNEQTIESDLDMSDEYEIPPSSSNATEDDFELEDSFDEGGKVGGKKKKPIQPIIINSESTNFDMVVVDEAHNFNNLFTSVVSEPKKIQTGKEDKKSGKIKIQREKNPYNKIRETSGGKDSSSRAEKLWFLARYIQYYNKMGNTILLSATPFTNSPLQIYSMLSFLSYEMLYDAELGILKDFFDTFAKIEYAEDFRTDLSIVKRNKFIGWTNVISLQKFVYRVFDKSSPAEEDKAVVRPNKWTLPLKRQMIEGKLVEFAKENFISTTIRMSDLQLELWKNVRLYAQGEVRYEELFAPIKRNTTSLGKYVDKTAKKATTAETEDGSAEVDVENTDDLADGTREEQKAKASAKALQCLMWGRQIALNPYLFKGSGFKKEPTGREYVEASPKLLYVMECIKSIKNFHEQNPDAKFYNPEQKRWVGGMSGQVIYMNFGTKAFELLRDYLVDELGFDINEIGIIRGDANFIGKKRYDNKQKVAQAFMGQEYDEVSGKTTFLEDSKRVKVLIGSESIKEGINLQDYSSALYNCFLDFNPTDQVQVEGRIWRQGNAFANVRIVTPLMADCIDIFMFQKLEDKTERINQIWTKNGNRNELDTTAFNPAELKYELLTDPVAIAVLEREYKRDKLEEQKTQEGEMLSSYLAISAIFKKSLEIKYNRINSSISKDFYFSMYYNISQVRPDLIEKPLLNQEGYLAYAETLMTNVLSDGWKTRRSIFTLEAFLEKYPNLYAFLDEMYNLPYGSEYNLTEANFSNPLWRMQFDKLFNYNAEQLIELMVQVLKEQKIGYPLGYSKNWRELIPEKPLPIVEGDEVEFDTKKGRKKGIAELVVNSDGSQILQSFFYNLLRVYAYEEYRLKLDEILKELKISKDILQKTPAEFASFSEKEKSDIITLLKWMYKNDSSDLVRDKSDGRIFDAFKPVALDVDELEDLNIVDRNIVLVEKGDKAKKKVEPTKYPEPFVWSNKDRNENIKDIAEYLGTIVFPKKTIGRRDYKNYVIDFVTKQPAEQIPMFSDEITSMPQILQGSANDFDAQNLKTYETTYLSNNWAELVEFWKDSQYGGMFNMYRTRFYNTELPLTLAEFKRTEEKKIKPLGINNFQDVENLILAQKEKINTLSLEQKNLDDEQVFEELVQEVMRRQQELNSDEIRAGSSFKGRADLFANPNSDYLGNNMLAIFRNSDVEKLAEVQEKVEKQMKEIAPTTTKTTIVEEEVIDVVKDEKAETQALISELEELLEFSTEAERAETQSLIDDLKELLEFN